MAPRSPRQNLEAALTEAMEDLRAGREVDLDEYQRKYGVGMVILRPAEPDADRDDSDQTGPSDQLRTSAWRPKVTKDEAQLLLAEIDARVDEVATKNPAGSDLNALAFAIHNLVRIVGATADSLS